MSAIFGALGLSNSDRSKVNTVGQRVVYDAAQHLLAQYSDELNAALSVFVAQTTSEYKYWYKLPSGGRLQRRGSQAPSGATKAGGQWDVAFPLEDFGAELAGDDITLAYMTMQEYDLHLDNIMIQDKNTTRFELLYALFNPAPRQFFDKIWGYLTIQAMANGDATLYPAVLGSENAGTENHYLATGYLASAISDTNNPFATARDELEEHFGATQGGSNIVTWINPNQTAKVELLTDFSEVPDRFIHVGDNTDYAESLPEGLPGERVIGRVNGVWVVEWRYIPDGYTLSVHLDAPKPLVQRVDPEDTGLPVGLVLVAKQIDIPMETAFYRHRFGFGGANRLNCVVQQFTTNGTYTPPAIYAI